MMQRHRVQGRARGWARIAPLAVLAALSLAASGRAGQDEAPTLREAFAQAAAYEFGQPRQALIVIADAVTDALTNPGWSAELEGRLVVLLEAPNTTDDCRVFVCRQLARIGTKASVPALARLLRDERLAHMARYALQRMPDDAAGSALRVALDDLEGPQLVGVINSVGERRDVKAIGPLTQLTAEDDPAVALASIAALGRIGGPAASDSLLEIAANSGDPVTMMAVCDALLVCADGLRETDPARAAGLYRTVLGRPAGTHRRMAALRGLTESDLPAAVPLIVELFGDDEETWRGFAAEVVRSARDPKATVAFGEALANLRPGPKTLLIAALGDRGEPAAYPFLLREMVYPDPAVRQAALQAAGSVGGPSAVAYLADVAAGPDEGDVRVARESLRRLRGDDVDEAMARALRDDSAGVRAELIDALGDRGASTHAGAVLAAADDPDPEVRRAALVALEKIGRAQDINGLVELIVKAPSEPDRRLAQAAAIAACLRTKDREWRSQAVVAAMENADRDAQESLLMVMGRIGGDRALIGTLKALETAELRDTAVAALAIWPDDAPAPDLLKLASSLRGTETGRVALHGYIRLAGLAGSRPPAETVAMYRRALELSDQAADRRAVLEGLSRVAAVEALAPAQALLADPEVADAAALAVIAVAEAIGTEHREPALAAIRDVLQRRDDAALRQRAGEATNRIEADEDFVTAWLVAGPYTRIDAGASALFDVAFPPEPAAPDHAVAWAGPIVLDADARGVLDLHRAIGGESRCAYARTDLWSDRARPVRLELGSDDGIKVWLNGAVVHAANAYRGLTVGSDVVDVDLREGRNPLLLKITQGGGDWGFCCRVRDPLGFHADGVRFAGVEALASPPSGATVLLDRGTGRLWTDAKGNPPNWAYADGVLIVRPGSGSIRTRAVYEDFIFHVEFMIPEQVQGVGQNRGNSGVYLQDRYEVQILDSWEQEPSADGCGAIYGRVPPRVNAARPPGAWQDYLIDFTAARWDGDGHKIRNARVSVWHNGVLIHDDVEIEGKTGQGAAEAPAPGPIVLQDHGHPIRFRNAWVLPDPPGWEGPEAAGFEALFDGRTLDGWRRLGGAAEYRVEDGQIVGTTRPDQPNTFLCTERLYDDFILELEFRVSPELNSGIQIRSNSDPDHRDGRVYGYQVEIDPSERGWTAGIYDEARRGWLVPLDESAPARAVFQRDGWNRLRVVALGDHIRTWLNGEPAAHLVDSMTRRGFIGLQVHGVGAREDPLEVRWRDIRIRPLRAVESRLPKDEPPPFAPT
jgi:HEAT repeat protein